MDESTIERLLRKARTEDPESGRGLSERARLSQRSVEAYLKAGHRPRWMERLSEIDRGMRAERDRLQRSYDALKAECAADPASFSRRWRAFAEAQHYHHLNQLIRQHNEWYPIERDLPMDPRTGEYVRVLGRTHLRPELGPGWVLEHFPA